MFEEKEDIVIVGTGLVGSLLATFIGRRGNRVCIYDKRPDPRQKIKANDYGRSINLALSNRGWRALERAGVADKLRDEAIPMKGRMIHDVKGNLTFQPYGKSGQAIYSISRNGLNHVLIDHAEARGNVQFNFNERCDEVDLEYNAVYFENMETGKFNGVKGGVIIGTDGAFSRVRLSMQFTRNFNFSQEYLGHGYKELTIPPNPDGSFKLEKNALHIWPRKSFMLIALPNADGSFTVTLFAPFHGEHSFESLQTKKDVTHFFETQFPDTIPLFSNLDAQFFENPTSSLITIRCYPWEYNRRVLLMGDAAHAIVPFYGQGMNAGFEDAFVFDQLIEKYQSNWYRILPEFQKLRKPNTDAIADLALKNYIEMRDSVADENFLLRKKIEARLHEIYPEKWIPLYTMVTFSDMPYAEALRIGKKQDQVMQEVMSIEDIRENWQTIDLGVLPPIQQYFNETKKGDFIVSDTKL